jgi:hypothetical protein
LFLFQIENCRVAGFVKIAKCGFSAFRRKSESIEALTKLVISGIPAKAGIQNALKNWIPGRAPLARNDDFLNLSRVLQEAPLISKAVKTLDSGFTGGTTFNETSKVKVRN